MTLLRELDAMRKKCDHDKEVEAVVNSMQNGRLSKIFDSRIGVKNESTTDQDEKMKGFLDGFSFLK